jgi:uncharacterized protein YqgC (DUF456 family)
MRGKPNHDLASAIGYGIGAACITVALGFAVGMALYSAYSETNDMAGFGAPQFGVFFAPFVGAIVGELRYGWLKRRRGE